MSQRRPGSAITVDSHTIVNLQEQMEKMHLANLKYAEEVKQLREMTLTEVMGKALKAKVEQGLATLPEEKEGAA